MSDTVLRGGYIYNGTAGHWPEMRLPLLSDQDACYSLTALGHTMDTLFVSYDARICGVAIRIVETPMMAEGVVKFVRSPRRLV